MDRDTARGLAADMTALMDRLDHLGADLQDRLNPLTGSTSASSGGSVGVDGGG
jgi:hypothetical protein